MGEAARFFFTLTEQKALKEHLIFYGVGVSYYSAQV